MYSAGGSANANEQFKDVKGPIPDSHHIPAPVGNAFTVDVMCEGKKLRALSSISQKDQGMCLKRICIPLPGKTFEIVVTLNRAREEGTLVGGRVYIDQKEADGDESEDDEEQEGESVEKGMDHLFWIGPGETSYSIPGFYEGGGQMANFRFGQARQSAPRGVHIIETVNVNAAKSLGNIRIDWFNVESFKRRRTEAPGSMMTSAATTIPVDPKNKSAILDSKLNAFSTVTEPGPRVREVFSDREGVLGKERIYRSQIKFRSFHDLINKRLIQQASDFHSVPLPLLLETFVRDHCFAQLMATLQEYRFNLTGEVVNPTAATRLKNEPVALEDIGHCLNERLSPEGAYVICTGLFPSGHNSNQVVQGQPRRGQEPNNAAFEEKEEGIRKYFLYKSDVHELTRSTRHVGSWEVKCSAIDLQLSDDESDVKDGIPMAEEVN
jgi:hypothetical protein